MLLLLMAMLATAAPPTPMQQLARMLHRYRSATVSRIRSVGPSVVLRDSVATVVHDKYVLSSAEVGVDWVDDVLAALLDDGQYDPNRYCTTECWPCDSADRLEVAAEFGHGRDAVTIVVIFGQRCVEVLPASGRAAAITLGPSARNLFNLIKSALPQDSTLQAMRYPPRTQEAMARLDSDVETMIRPLPALGEYVELDERPWTIIKRTPEYPESAADANVDGTVIVQALVDVDGRVVDTRVVKSIRWLDGAAVAAVRRWEFSPGAYRGLPAAAWIACPVKFVLPRREARWIP
jgi:TonB family protein